MSKRDQANNVAPLPTVDEALAGMGLHVLGAGEAIPPAAIGLPSWVGEADGTAMPAALTMELASYHDQKDVAQKEVNRVDAERAALFRGFLVGAGLPMTAQYDLSTGMVTVPKAE